MKVASIRKCNLTAGNPPDDCTAFVSPVDSTLLAYLRKLLGCPICPRTGARQYYKLRPELRRIPIPRTPVNRGKMKGRSCLRSDPSGVPYGWNLVQVNPESSKLHLTVGTSGLTRKGPPPDLPHTLSLTSSHY